jgi:hypothetical protein
MGKFGNIACFSINSSIMFSKMSLHLYPFISSTAVWFHLSPSTAFVFFSPSALLLHSHSLLHFLQPGQQHRYYLQQRGRRAKGEKIERKKRKKTNAIGGDK